MVLGDTDRNGKCICATCRWNRSIFNQPVTQIFKDLGQKMSWLKKQYTSDLPAWDVKTEDFVETPLENYKDPHLQSLLIDVREIIPERFRSLICVAGGFASNLTGITVAHGDIDLFCLTKEVFDEQLKIIRKGCGTLTGSRFRDRNGGTDLKLIDNRSYGKILKFKYEGFDYDLVDASILVQSQRSSIGVLRSFDLNWSMAAINLARDVAIHHPEAYSNEPKINPKCVDMHIGSTINRLDKYSERLVQTPNNKMCEEIHDILLKREVMFMEQNRAQKSSGS